MIGNTKAASDMKKSASDFLKKVYSSSVTGENYVIIAKVCLFLNELTNTLYSSMFQIWQVASFLEDGLFLVCDEKL